MGLCVKIVALVVTVVVVQEANAARILMAVPIGTKSHNNFFMPLAEHLAQWNHTVSCCKHFVLFIIMHFCIWHVRN